MHALHRILVNLEKINVTKEYLQNNRKEAINCVRDCAAMQTEDFYGIAFDWRETNNAGSWSDEFPENVLFGSEKPEFLLEQMQHCKELQKEEISNYLNYIKKETGDSLSSIVEYASKEPIKSLGVLCSLRILANLLSERYCFDSYFYDLEEGTGRIDIEKVRQSPEQWALVLFDYHN